MTNILTILLLTFSLAISGQTCDTINNEVVNCFDSLGFKQGYWLEFDTLNKIVTSKPLGSRAKNDERIASLKIEPKAKGYYKDGSKVDTWIYYSNIYWGAVDRRITYFEDGSIKVENPTKLYELNINSDTTIVTGQVYHELDTINILCRTQNCALILPNGQRILSFQFDSLDMLEFELLRLIMGEYDRKIKIKNAR